MWRRGRAEVRIAAWRKGGKIASEGPPEATLRQWRATIGGQPVVLRTETKRTLAQGTETISVRVQSLAKTLKVGTREVSCVVTQTTRINGDQKFEGTRWTSLEVPGGIVKEEQKETGPDHEPRLSTVELLEFGGELTAPAGKK